jgi:hypothetical protein
VLQITLVTDEHYDNVLVGVIAQLLQPPCDICVRSMLGDIIYEQSTDCAAVISVRIQFEWSANRRVFEE